MPVLGISAGGSAAYLEPIVRTLAEGVIEPKTTKKTARAAYNECVRFATKHVDALIERWEEDRAKVPGTIPGLARFGL